MVLASEGDKIRHVITPPRDRRYTIIGYSKYLVEAFDHIAKEVLPIIINALTLLSI